MAFDILQQNTSAMSVFEHLHDRSHVVQIFAKLFTIFHFKKRSFSLSRVIAKTPQQSLDFV